MLRSDRTFARCLLAGIAAISFHGVASAQATRTWVSGVGNDANPCSRTAPCKTFAGAISKTAAGGEIDVLDPGGFGAVTITKALTINGYGEGGGILNSGTNGIIVNCTTNPTTDVVVLRNLSIQGGGAPGATSGTNGIKFLAGAALHLENVTISAQNAVSPNGYGVWINPTAGNVQVFMDHVAIVDNGNGTTGGGIYLQPMNPATATLQISNSQIADNQGFAGLRVDSGGFANVVFSSITGNAQHGAVVVSSANPADIAIQNSMISGNGVSPANNGAGVQSQGTVASARIANSTVTDNEHGLRAQSSGILVSYGNNMVFGNTTDGAVTSTIGGF
jgi:hypothetical protein